METRFRAGGWLCAIALLLPAEQRADAAAPSTSLRLLLVRTTTGPSTFSLGIEIQPKGDATFTGAYGYAVSRGKVTEVAPLPFTTVGKHSSPVVYSSPMDVRPCSSPCLTAVASMASAYSYEDKTGAGTLNRLLVVVDGGSTTVSFRATGWKLTHPSSVVHRHVEAADSDALGAAADRMGVEVFFGASAPGGSRGSLASVRPPCATTGAVNLAQGVGRVTLAGGSRSVEVTCPTDLSPIGAFATRSTIWSVTGQMAGVSNNRESRLWVIDLSEALVR